MMSDEEYDITSGKLHTRALTFIKKEFKEHLDDLDERLLAKGKRKRVTVGVDYGRTAKKAASHPYFQATDKL